MGVDRWITYRGEKIASCGRAYHFDNTLEDREQLFIELWRLIRLYDTDFDAFIEGIREWVEMVENTGKAELLKYICEDEGVGVVDE